MTEKPIGIIEGFYGKSWTWKERTECLSFLKEHGADLYVYAPKSDRILREDWLADWDKSTFKKLQKLCRRASALSVHFGMGLSLFGVQEMSKKDLEVNLKKKIRRITDISPDVLCILFDDMPGGFDNLAHVQCGIVNRVRQWSTAGRIIFCPTYYSSAEILERISGKMPEHYWEDIGRLTDRGIDIFWTGEGICSLEYPVEHLETIRKLLRRKPFLWDNYPVNDCRMSDFLHLRSVDRPQELLAHISGIVINPMNQPCLSRIPIAEMFAQLLGRQCEHTEMERIVLEDVHLFQDIGLEKLSPEEKQALLKKYSALLPDPYAAEIVAWLDGN